MYICLGDLYTLFYYYVDDNNGDGIIMKIGILKDCFNFDKVI